MDVSTKVLFHGVVPQLNQQLSSSEGTDTDSKVCRQKPTNKKLKKSFQKVLTNNT